MNETQKRLVGAYFASEDSASRAVISHRHVSEMLGDKAHLHLTGNLLDIRTKDFHFIVITDDQAALYDLIQDSPRHHKPIAPIFYFGSKADQDRILSIAQEHKLQIEYFPISSDAPEEKLNDTIPINPLLFAITSLLSE